MQIVANSYMLNKFRTIKSFKLDLGNSLIPLQEKEVRLMDNFIFKYHTLTSKQVLKFGEIGKLKFYQDFNLNDKNFLIFNDESTYSVDYDGETEVEEFISDILKEIKEKEGIKDSNLKGKEMSKDPDLKLPDSKYLEEMIKRRRK